MPDNRGMWQGLERATGNMAATGMGLLNYQAQRQDAANRLALQEKQFGLQKEQAQIQNAKSNMELEQLQKQKALLAKPIDITTTPQFLSLPEEQRPNVLKFFSTGGFTDEGGRGTVESVTNGMKMMASTKELSETYLKPVIEAKKQAVISAWGEVVKAQESGDPEKVKKSMANYTSKNKIYQATSEKWNEHLMKLDEIEMAKTDKQKIQPNITGVDARGNPVRVPDVPGASVYQKPFAPKAEKGEVTWTTATSNLSKRFSSYDSLGNIVITKGLQNKHKLAQKKLVELKKQGMDPLEAVNTSEDYANNVEGKYWEYITAASELSGKEQKIAEDKINAAYKNKYGYLPR